MTSQNVETKADFDIVAILPGLTIEESDSTFDEVEGLILEQMGVRVQILEEIKTNPDLDEDGNNVPETGGRNDVIIAVHNDDIPKFAIARLPIGGRWMSDALDSCSHLYPERFKGYI